MAEITAATVKELRERTGLPMMKCKQALVEAAGDLDKAIEVLRKEGEKFSESRGERETSAGRFAVYTDFEGGVGTMVELLCESSPVANNEEFRQLANDLATQLATGPGANTPEELLAQDSPSKQGQTLLDQFNELTGRIREVFKLNRLVRIDAPCGGYAHHTGTAGVLLEVSGGNPDVAKDICMHIAAMRPIALGKDDLDPALVAKEREFLAEAAKKEGKPENIIEKMVDGRMRNFYAERCLTEQPFVKDDKKTVGQVAKEAGMELKRFVHWELGR